MVDHADKRVLVVEDQYLIALDLEGHIRALGFGEVMLAANANEALEIAASEPIAVALLDMGLEEEDTSEALARELAARGIAFVVVTGFADTFEDGHAFHGVPVVRKPYRAEDLRDAIEQVLPHAGGQQDPGQ